MDTVVVSTMKELQRAMSVPEVTSIFVRSGQNVLEKVLTMNSAGQLAGKMVPPSLVRLAMGKPQFLKDVRWPVVAIFAIAAAVMVTTVAMVTPTKMTLKWKVTKIGEGEIMLERSMIEALAQPKLATDSP